MAYMGNVERWFESSLRSGRLEWALQKWQQKHPCLGGFGDSSQLVKFMRDPSSGKLEKDHVLRALTTRSKTRDQEAGTLLLYLFLGAFRRARSRIGPCHVSEEELEAEMLAGFWEEVARPHPPSVSVAARLFYAINNAAWKAVRLATEDARRRVAPAQALEDFPSSSAIAQHLPDISALLLEAADARLLSQDQLDLLWGLAVEGRTVEELAASMDVSTEAVSMRRARAEARLARLRR